MKSKLMIGSAAFGLFLGGLVVGQALSSDAAQLTLSKVGDLPSAADSLYASYTTALISAKSAAQISQVADETSVRMNYIQVKQNAEIIRLLTVISTKK